MQLSRTGTFAAGAVMALVIGGGTAVAAGGTSVLLGAVNSSKATTSLADGKGTPLSLTAKKGYPPLRVSSDVKVKNLDADELDGKDSSAFLPSSGTAADAARLGGQPSSAYLPAGGTAADAAKLGGQPASAYLPAGGTAADAAKLAGQPAAAYVSTVYTASTGPGSSPILLHSATPIDPLSLPAGTYAVSFNADLDDTGGAGYFECQITFTEGSDTDGAYFADTVVGNSTIMELGQPAAANAPVPAIVSNTYASASFSDVISLPAATSASVVCRAIQGDDGHTSSVFSSNLSATLLHDVRGTPDTFHASMTMALSARQH